MTQYSGDVSSFFSGDLRLIVFHSGSVSGFTLVGGSLCGNTGSGYGGGISVSFGLCCFRSSEYGSNIGIRFSLCFFSGSHYGSSVSSFLRRDLLLIGFYSFRISGFTLVSGSLRCFARGNDRGNISIRFGLCGFSGGNHGKTFSVGLSLCLFGCSLYSSGVRGFLCCDLRLIGFYGGNVIAVGIGKCRNSKNSDHANGKQEREKFFHDD